MFCNAKVAEFKLTILWLSIIQYNNNETFKGQESLKLLKSSVKIPKFYYYAFPFMILQLLQVKSERLR